jgi:hypothetical protein
MTDRGRKLTSADVGHALKALYDATAREPVPDDLLATLERLPSRGKPRGRG